MLANYMKLSEAYVFIYVVTMKSTVKCMLFFTLFTVDLCFYLTPMLLFQRSATELHNY